MRRMPATSGTVSMSKTSSGVIVETARRRSMDAARRRSPDAAHVAAPAPAIESLQTSCGKHARGQIAVAAIADDEHDGRILDRSRNAHRHCARAARADAAKDAFFARQAARVILGVGLPDAPSAIDPGR